MINIALCGGYGRMGRTIAGLCESGEEFNISYIIETNDKCLLTNIGIGIKLEDIIDHDDVDVVVDFTYKSSCLEHMKISVDHGKPFVTGTTGFSDDDMAKIKILAEKGKVFYSPNFSPGIYILGKALQKISELAKDDYDIEMIEMHHNQKTDAPSGTALKLRDLLLGSYPSHNVIYGRKGDYKPRSREEIAIHTLRGGDVVGDHQVIFAGNGERLELTHRAISRNTFAFGVLKAVEYITKQNEKRLYGMDDLF